MAAGYSVVALEPSKKLAAHLRTIDGLDVVEAGTEKLEEVCRYDGIWACASLIHLDDKRLNEALQHLQHALKPGGYLYMSFKDGERFRVAANGRHFRDMTPDMLGQLSKKHGLTVVESWQSTSKLSGTNEAPWNNVIGRKPA
jgi:SAM-dependent methyltransferase